MATELEINKELVVSICHIPEETSDWLESPQGLVQVYDIHEYGHRIFIPGDNKLAQEEADAVRELGMVELSDLMTLAKNNDCKWLVLDCDGPYVDTLPQFDW